MKFPPPRFWNLALLLTLILVYAGIAWRDSASFPAIFGDEQVHSRVARLVPFSQAEMTAYLYFGVYRLTSSCGDGFLACARYLNLLFFIGAAPFIYLVARKYAALPAAALCALVAVLAPMNIYTSYFMPESMYFFAFWLMTWLVLARQWAHWAVQAGFAGAALGAMALVKVHGLFLLPALLPYLLFAGWHARRGLAGFGIGLAAAALALVAFGAVKFGLGYLFAGANGLHLLGSFYEHQASNGASVTTMLPGALRSLKGHLLMLSALSAVPLAALAYFLVSRKAWSENAGRNASLIVYTLLMVGAALGLTVFYTASVAGYGPVEGLRLHARYYNFALPLLLIIAVARTGEGLGAQRSAPRWIIAALLALALGYAAVALPTQYVPVIVDTPEFMALGADGPRYYASLVLALEVAALALWAGNRQLGGYAFLCVFLPVYLAHGAQVNQRFVAHARMPTLYDKAGRFAASHIPPAERNQVTIVGNGTGELMRAKFHVDGPDTEIVDLPEGWPLYPYAISGRQRWMLVVGDHPLPPGVTPFAREDGYLLLRLDPDHRSLGIVKTTGPLEGALLEKTAGLGAPEPWGRWTHGPLVTLDFAAPLPKQLHVLLTAQAFGSNVGKPFVVRAGDQEQSFILSAWPQEVMLRFATDGKQQRLAITTPQALAPTEAGGIGMGLSKIEIGTVGRP